MLKREVIGRTLVLAGALVAECIGLSGCTETSGTEFNRVAQTQASDESVNRAQTLNLNDPAISGPSGERPVILINGHPGAADQVEAIPYSTIERIELLHPSTLERERYGARDGQNVVNIILKAR